MYVINKTRCFGCILCNTVRRNCSRKSAKKLLQNDASKLEIKVTNAKILRRFNKENKLLFGSLVETLPQKRKRERKEPVGEECNYSSDNDGRLSEAWWWEKSLKNRVERTTTGCTLSALSEQHRISISSNVQDITESKGTEVSRLNIPSPSKAFSEKDVGKVETRERHSIFHKSDIRLPEIIVKNLTTFPLDNKGKHSVNAISTSTHILNIPVKQESGSGRTQYNEYPSVSRILNATMSDSSRAALQKWKENMIAELGEEGFQKYQRALLEHGSMFHGTVQRFLSGVPVKDISIDPAVEGCWHSMETTLKEISTVKVLESHVVHEELLYHGIIDCVAVHKEKLLVIEWKKSNKQKSAIWNTFDAPLQVAAYLGAMNFDCNYGFKVNGGLVVVAYTDGSPAHVHHLDLTQCQKYWRMWLKRLQMYWELFHKQNVIETCQV